MPTNWAEHKPLQSKRTELQEVERQFPVLQTAASNAAAKVTAAERSLTECETAAALGRATQDDVSKQRTHLDMVKVESEEAAARVAANRRAVEILRSEVREIEAEAKEQARAEWIATYKPLVGKLFDLLTAAADVNVELETMMRDASGLTVIESANTGIPKWPPISMPKPVEFLEQASYFKPGDFLGSPLDLWLDSAEKFIDPEGYEAKAEAAKKRKAS